MRKIVLFAALTASFTALFANDEDKVSDAESVKNSKYSYEIVEFENDQIPVDEILFNEHISELEFVIPMVYNSYVKRQIDYFGTRWQHRLKEVLSKSEFYFPIYEEIMDKNDMPLELKYLSVIESALNPYAVSRSGAVGLWQFMPATGRIFDLQQSYVMDERRSVEKSTEAAASYLKSMYEMFGDWHVAIASYNCGPGNVRKAIRYSGRTDFWGMLPYLPKETQNYVPKFIAMAYIMSFHDRYGITAMPEIDIIGKYHPVYCKTGLSFSIIADYLEIDKEYLMSLNPELKEKVIPNSSNGYWLNIPVEKVERFYVLENDIQVCSVEDDLAKKEMEAAQPKVIYHTVKKGECLPIIAKKYGCSVSQLQTWNNIKGSLIYPNQKLKIYRS